MTNQPENEFHEHHIKLIWNYLHEHFGFDRKGWKAKFNEYRKDPQLLRSGHDNSELSHFYLFGNTVINPVLNKILCRNEAHPTFNKLVRFIVTGKKQE